MTNSLEQYKVFYHVVKQGSITAAAGILAISQPAVSQTIRQLETHLQTTLLIRTAKGVRLTEEGKLLYSYIERGYEQIELGEQKLKKLLELDAGEIRIGASDMTLKYYLLPYLEQFHSSFPKIKVTVYNSPTPETLNTLKAGRIDFGLISSPIKEEKGLYMRKVKEIEDVFVAGTKFNYLKDQQLDYSELSKLPIICLEQNTSTRKYLDSFLLKSMVELSPEFELATSDMIVQFAIRNLGIGAVMSEFAKEAIEKEELFCLKFKENIPRRWFYVVYDRKSPLSTAAGHLLGLMTETK